MTLSNRIQRIYRALLRQLHTWGLPLLIVGGFLTSFWLDEINQESYFTRLEVASLHRLAGIFLGLLVLLLIYDWLYFYDKPKDRARLLLRPKELLQWQRSIPFQTQVSNWFYTILILICVTGGLNLLGLDAAVYIYFSPTTMMVLHEYLAWIFLSLITIRYFFLLQVWIGYLVETLRKN